MANPIWSEKESRWSLRIQRDGITRKFTSVKPGPAGKREVLRRAREWNGNPETDRKEVVSALWDKYLARYLDEHGDCEQLLQHKRIGKSYILPRVGKIRIDRMRLDDWQSLISDAKPQGVKRLDGSVYMRSEALSRKTLSNIRGTVSQFCTFLVARGYMDALLAPLYVPRTAKTEDKVILQPSELKRLFDLSEPFADDWTIDMWRLMAVTGIRPGEALGIKKSDVVGETLTISRSVNSRGKITAGKNANARRKIYLHGLAKEILDRQFARIGDLKSDWIFPNRAGGMQLQGVAFEGFKRIAESLGVPGAYPYCLRHTFISLIKYDVPEQMIKNIVGHSVKMDTFGTYGHAVDGEDIKAGNIIDIALRRKIN